MAMPSAMKLRNRLTPRKPTSVPAVSIPDSNTINLTASSGERKFKHKALNHQLTVQAAQAHHPVVQAGHKDQGVRARTSASGYKLHLFLLMSKFRHCWIDQFQEEPKFMPHHPSCTASTRIYTRCWQHCFKNTPPWFSFEMADGRQTFRREA